MALLIESREDGMDSADGEGACPRSTAAKIRSTVSSDSFEAMSNCGTEECYSQFWAMSLSSPQSRCQNLLRVIHLHWVTAMTRQTSERSSAEGSSSQLPSPQWMVVFLFLTTAKTVNEASLKHAQVEEIQIPRKPHYFVCALFSLQTQVD